jgi:hypothetical protein
MRPIVLAIAVAALAVASSGCSDPCKELGDRLCDCAPVGVTKAACSQGVNSQIDNLHPGQDVKDVCAKKLETCHAPTGVKFCDWIDGRCGKSACGLSEEDLAALQAGGTCP